MDFRPLRRFKQAASEEECLSILQSAPRGVLSLAGDNGYPYGIPLNFIYQDGSIFFHCAGEGHKLDAIRANDKACFTVMSEPLRNEGQWWYCITSVIAFGRIGEVEDPERKDRLLRALGAKYFPEEYDIETDIRRNGPRALVMQLTVDHISGKHVKEK